MSDDTDVPAVEPDEAAQDAAVQEAASPPWGDDFDPERAWKTITNLRQFEKQAKEFERLQSDESYRDEWVRKHYSFVEDEPGDADDSDEVDFEEDDPVKPLTEKLTALEKWQQEREAERVANQIREDLTAINDGSDWELDDYDRELIVANASRDPRGFNRDALERAHKTYIDRLNRAGEVHVERAKKPKPSPSHVPKGGTAATGTKNVSEMTTREREQFMIERAQQMMSGS